VILHDLDIEKGNAKMGAFMIQVQVIYTALMAGMMLMYTITLGRYFDYILKHKIPGASQNWALFHNNTRVQIHHTAVLVGHAMLSIISLATNYTSGPAPLVVAAAVPFLMLTTHVVTGFAKAEFCVNGAQQLDNEKTVKTYLAWNMPLHITYTLLYTVSAALLLTLL